MWKMYSAKCVWKVHLLCLDLVPDNMRSYNCLCSSRSCMNGSVGFYFDHIPNVTFFLYCCRMGLALAPRKRRNSWRRKPKERVRTFKYTSVPNAFSCHLRKNNYAPLPWNWCTFGRLNKIFILEPKVILFRYDFGLV